MLERLVYRLARSVLLWDTLLTILCWYLALLLHTRLPLGTSPLSTVTSWQSLTGICLIWITVFLLLTPQRALFVKGLMEAIGRLVLAIVLAAMVFAGALYLAGSSISRLRFTYFIGLDLLVLLAFHIAVRSAFLFRRTKLQRRTLIVGPARQAQELAGEFERRPWTGIAVVGYTCEEPDAASPLPYLGSVEQTATIVEQQKIDEIIFASWNPAEIVRISLQLQHLPVMIHIIPSILDLVFARTPVETIGGIPLISLRESALSESQRLFKRIFDIIASSILLLILWPIMLLIAIAIKLESPGPVFFRQERIGEHGQRFKMLKFRSMYQDAEERWMAVARRDEQGRLIHKVKDDPRITRVGRKLRRTSLDELPQLINVLKGEMSLVGPRPEMPYIASEYQPWQWQRFRVPPGMTGWWQINGRSGRPMHLSTDDDLYYIQNYSFWLDLKILWKTIGAVVKGHGAF